MAVLVTPRQREIVTNLLNGFCDKEIALQMGTSQQTVKSQMANLVCKLEANSRIHAIAIALRKGEIQL